MGYEEDIAAAIARLTAFDLKVNVDNARKMEAAMLYVLRYAMMFCPVDEGALRANTATHVQIEADGIRGRLYNPMEYAPFVHQGTGIYAVDGNGRKTPWVWKGDGKKYAGWHRTVGNRSQPFIKNAVEQNLSGIEAIFGGD